MALTTPDIVVLSLLIEGPMHGYKVVQELERREVRDWAGISRPQVYYSLRKLEKEGLISATELNQEGSLGPERTVYMLTKQAPTAVADALAREQWSTQRPPPPFLTWLALAAHARSETIDAMFRRRRRFLEEQIAKEEATLTALAHDGTPMTKVGTALVSLTIRQFTAELLWLEEAYTAVQQARSSSTTSSS